VLCTRFYSRQGGVLSTDVVRATLDELCRRDVPARTSNDEITLYKAVGTALADLAAATMVYEAGLIAG
jgi:ornithine cyclodeaminase